MLTVRDMAARLVVVVLIIAMSLTIKDYVPTDWHWQVGWTSGFLAAVVSNYWPSAKEIDVPPLDQKPPFDPSMYIVFDGDCVTVTGGDHPHRRYSCPKCGYSLKTNEPPEEFRCWRDDTPLVEVEDEA